MASDLGHTGGDGIETRDKEDVVNKVVRCTCGIEIRETDEARLIERVQRHAKESHDLTLDDEQVRAMMEIDQ